MQFSLLKSCFSRGQGIDGPGHAVGEAGHEVEFYGGVVGVVPLVVRFRGVGFEVVEFATASAVCCDEFVAVGAYHGGMCGRIFMALHGVVIFAVDVVAVLVEGRVAFQEWLEVRPCMAGWRSRPTHSRMVGARSTSSTSAGDREPSLRRPGPEMRRGTRTAEFVEEGAFEVDAVVAEHFAVVRGEDDIGVVALTGFFKAVEQVADLPVNDIDHGPIRRGEPAVIGVGHLVVGKLAFAAVGAAVIDALPDGFVVEFAFDVVGQGVCRRSYRGSVRGLRAGDQRRDAGQRG